MGVEIPLWLFYLLVGMIVTPFVVLGSVLMLIGGLVVITLWPRRKKRGGLY